MRLRTRAAVMGAAIAAVLAAAAPAAAKPTWAPAGGADIRPGSMTFTEGGQCTSNFVFFDAADNDVYLGQAAHCSGTGDATATNGCESESLPLGTQVEIEGASQPGTLVYNSWLSMQKAGETDHNACQFNDFALVQIDPADVAEVNPTLPFWGGPIGPDATTRPLESVFSYGNSSLRLGVDLLRPKFGKTVGQGGGGWTHDVLTVTPGVPGDSGSAFIDRRGRALGTLSTLQILPLAGSNGVTDLSLALDYMRSTGFAAELAEGTEAFRAPRVPLL